MNASPATVPELTLATATDYIPALLWLVDRIGQAPTAEAVAAFEHTFGDRIPDAHRELISSGSPRWDNYIRWARQALVNAGLMDGSRRGLWAISDAGHVWLRD